MCLNKMPAIRRTVALVCLVYSAGTGLPDMATASHLPGQGSASIAAEEMLASSSQPPESRHLEVLDVLENTGYTLVELRRTWLNRILIRARNAQHLREIVISRSTGSILRDVVVETYAPTTGSSERWPGGMPPEDISPDDIDPELFR